MFSDNVKKKFEEKAYKRNDISLFPLRTKQNKLKEKQERFMFLLLVLQNCCLEVSFC